MEKIREGLKLIDEGVNVIEAESERLGQLREVVVLTPLAFLELHSAFDALCETFALIALTDEQLAALERLDKALTKAREG